MKKNKRRQIKIKIRTNKNKNIQNKNREKEIDRKQWVVEVLKIFINSINLTWIIQLD